MKIAAVSTNQTGFQGLKTKTKSPLNFAYAAIVPLMTLMPVISNAQEQDTFKKEPITRVEQQKADSATAPVVIGLISAAITYMLTGNNRKH